MSKRKRSEDLEEDLMHLMRKVKRLEKKIRRKKDSESDSHEDKSPSRDRDPRLQSVVQRPGISKFLLFSFSKYIYFIQTNATEIVTRTISPQLIKGQSYNSAGIIHDHKTSVVIHLSITYYFHYYTHSLLHLLR